jgi:GABA(A) receptor-associated protein
MKYKDGFEAREKNPSHVPVYVYSKIPNSYLPFRYETEMKTKYLVPENLQMGQFVHTVRKHEHIDASKALFLYVNNNLPSVSTTLIELYNKHKDEDGCLKVILESENTFG